MKKNGFTLIEIIAVIAILAIILVIAVPKINNNIADNKEKIYQSTIKELKRVSSQYVINHPNLLTDTTFTISINTLCNNKYIECPVIDPRTNEEMNGNIVVSYENNIYTYTYVDDN